MPTTAAQGTRPSPRCTTSGPASTPCSPGSTTPTGARRPACPVGTCRPSSPTSSAPSRCCSARRRRPSTISPRPPTPRAQRHRPVQRGVGERAGGRAAGRRAGPVPRPTSPGAWRRSTRRRRRRGTRSGSRRPARTRTAGSCDPRLRLLDARAGHPRRRRASAAARRARPPRSALDEMAAAMGYVVGKKAGAPQGSRVALELTGPAAPRPSTSRSPSGPPSSTSSPARRR